MESPLTSQQRLPNSMGMETQSVNESALGRVAEKSQPLTRRTVEGSVVKGCPEGRIPSSLLWTAH